MIINQIREIYNLLLDEYSKKLFLLKLAYNVSGDLQIHERMIDYVVDELQKSAFRKKIEKISSHKKIVLWGSGSGGNHVYQYLKHFYQGNILCCDKYKEGCFHNMPILSPSELISLKGNICILISVFNKEIQNEIMKECLEMGFCKEDIIIADDYMEIQYFDNRIKEVIMAKMDKAGGYLDAGCYDLGTVLNWMEWSDNSESCIWALEPDISNYSKCTSLIEKLDLKNIDLLPYAAWNKNEQVAFENTATGASKISEKSECKVQGRKIDDIVSENKCSFIKMDIEGSELQALEGAKSIIIRDRPILAICVYHRKEDIIEIPLWIKELNLDYKFLIRHYSPERDETVLYAV